MSVDDPSGSRQIASSAIPRSDFVASDRVLRALRRWPSVAAQETRAIQIVSWRLLNYDCEGHHACPERDWSEAVTMLPRSPPPSIKYWAFSKAAAAITRRLPE